MTTAIIIAAPIAAFLIGCTVGFKLALWAVNGMIREGEISRADMMVILSKWRGPNGERWSQ